MNEKITLSEIVPDARAIAVVDIGASYHGGADEAYWELVRRGLAYVIAFEPDNTEREKLIARYGASHTFLPHFVGSGGTATFYKTKESYTGSLLEPNAALLAKFQTLDTMTRVIDTQPVQTVRLDDIAEVKALDFLKIDVQGAELSVFNGAQRLLSECLVIQTEVEFVELYKGQPLFADIDQCLRARGFQFHRFMGFGSRCFKPLAKKGNLNAGGSQHIWSDAIYVRDFMAYGKMPAEALKKLALLVHDVFGSIDLCLMILNELDLRSGKGPALQTAYMNLASGKPSS